MSEADMARVCRELPEWAVRLIATLVEQNQQLGEQADAANRLAHRDDVSGLPNRRAADDLLPRLVERHKRDRAPLSVLFIDGDDLGEYNKFGYEAGNAMIAELAGILQSRLRPTDCVVRWLSGDEFLVILPGASPQAAHAVAERLRRSVEEGFSSAPVPVTISVGLASMPGDGDDAASLVKRAIDCQAAAKRAGKNRVVTASATETVFPRASRAS